VVSVLKKFKEAISKPRYQTIVTGIFFLSVIICGIGSVVLSIEYLAVYDTANKFLPQVTRIAKSTISEEARSIVVEIETRNDGSRLLHIWGYRVLIILNDAVIANRDVFRDIFLQPGQVLIIEENFTIIGSFAQRIIDAEQSDEWNWIIQYPMRVYVGGWLYVSYGHFAVSLTGVEEVN
jgi:hypothetical protein